MDLLRAKRRSETLPVWDLPLRLFHWLLVGSTILAFASADAQGPLALWHRAAGWCAAVLIVFRVVWGVIGSHHARFTSFIKPARIVDHLRDIMAGRARRAVGHNPLGGIAIILMLSCLGAVIGSGHAAETAASASFADSGLSGSDLHARLAWATLGLILLHIAAVIAKSLSQRENLVSAMITGHKSACKHPAARRRGHPSPAAFLLAVAIAAVAADQIHAFSPDAFSPGRPEQSALQAASGHPPSAGRPATGHPPADHSAARLADSLGASSGGG